MVQQDGQLARLEQGIIPLGQDIGTTSLSTEMSTVTLSIVLL